MAKAHIQPIFSRQVAYIRQASSALLAMVNSDDITERKKLEKEVKLCEVQGDAMLTEIYGLLNENIFSRFTKVDLQTVAVNLDEVLDNINDSAKAVIRYMPNKMDPQLVELAEYIVAEADALTQIVSGLDDMKKKFSMMTMQCDRITEIEHAADETYEDYVGEIFQTEKDAIELMKHKNIAEMLETTTDTAKAVSDHVRKLVISALRLIRKSSCTTVHCGFLIFASLEIPPFEPISYLLFINCLQ